ncbi:hypothetical protein [Pedobacter zeae]|uniref:Uncharacterized protein n=1 Tax=Pedobacter zeae TaxID=1737356 RepID=A0A7W6K9K9_9SPHI|nr:hypothetical protein [Pedobacter zeae]MBB4107741.1 hypothetical protein [Pedobacter zeae]GGG97350.1 hypothetical protein GCM10007422_09130 [Pedobacter zeae]
MKTLLSLTLGLLLSISLCYAQTPNSLKDMLSSPTHAATDTVTNAGVKYQIAAVQGFQDVVTIQTVITKISGTVAGTVIIQGSLDGVNYTTIGTDSFTATDVASQSKSWSVNPSTFAYYRVSYTGAGTMSAKINSKLLFRKRS